MQIIINADDFGSHSDINTGILDAYRSGLVTSASLIVNADSAAEAAALARGVPGLAVGLHFNLTAGHCTAPVHEVPALVDSEGRFRFDSRDVPGSVARWRALLASDGVVLDQVEREFWAQVKRFRGYGLEPDHLDAHHYLPLIHIDLFVRYVDLANQLEVPFRGLCHPMVNMLRVPQGILAEMRDILCRSRHPSPQVSLSNLLGSRPAEIPPAGDYQQLVEARLSSLAGEGIDTVELVTHPTRITDTFRQHDDYAWARELETALVTSDSFACFLRSHDYRPSAHASLR